MPGTSPEEPSSISLDDIGDVIQARWRHLNGRQRCIAIMGAALILTGGGLALADILTAGILVSLVVDFALIALGLAAFLWIAFQLKILTRGHVEQTRQSATRAAVAAVQAIAPPPPRPPVSSSPADSNRGKE